MLFFIPIGMMILLQRLPDDTKEEVRNQIIVLINQMTATNEEMKKTVGKLRLCTHVFH